MKTLAQEYAEYSRQTTDDGSVQPTLDNGFRMKATEPFIYVPKRNPPEKKYLDHIHCDDIKTFTQTALRGIHFITVDEDAANARITEDIARNIAQAQLTAVV